MAGQLIFENDTGSPRSLNDANGCQTRYAVALGNDRIPPSASFPQPCVHEPLVIPVGESRVAFTLQATCPYRSPTGHGPGTLPLPQCAQDGVPPPLPPGMYYATFVDNGTHLPPPSPVAIRVVPS